VLNWIGAGSDLLFLSGVLSFKVKITLKVKRKKGVIAVMEWSLIFFLNSIMLGVGLAMDAFSVSLANGLEEPDMRPAKMCGIAAVFGIFQALMPLAGWTCVHTVVKIFNSFSSIVPWIALILLGYIGVKMLFEGIKNKNGSGDQPQKKLTVSILFFQGIATSIDALSVGFTIADYGILMAILCSLIIAVVTFIICMAGLELGKRFGVALSDKASVLGGVILIVIGVEIFITGIF
jgi:UPF0059 membrane protein FAEPRAM212_01767